MKLEAEQKFRIDYARDSTKVKKIQTQWKPTQANTTSRFSGTEIAKSERVRV
jgi:hypothetical protein